MRAKAFVAIAVALAALGCGARKASAPRADGGGTDPPLTGRWTYDVSATLTVKPAAPGLMQLLPPTTRLSLTLDADRREIIVGGGGFGDVVAVTTSDGATFRATRPFGVWTNAMDGARIFTYDTFELRPAAGSLAGHAEGTTQVSIGDVVSAVPFSAELAGGPDVTAPFLVTNGLSAANNVFLPFEVHTSEPLPVTSRARLVAGDGASIDLPPRVVPGDLPATWVFESGPVVLPPSESYTVTVDGLVDFAGNSGAAGAPLRLTGSSTPPLVPEDGFESPTGAMLAGVVAGGDLAPLSGTRSFYLGDAKAPGASTNHAGQVLFVRLAVNAGDKVLRFAYRTVSPQAALGFNISISLGSVGKSIGGVSGVSLLAPAAPTTWSTGEMVYLGAVQTMEVPLPADAAAEAVVMLLTNVDPAAPRSVGLLVDDLRLE